MNEYLKAQSKINDTILDGSFNTDELNRFSKSDFRWADNRKKPLPLRHIRKGEIYQFEFDSRNVI